MSCPNSAVPEAIENLTGTAISTDRAAIFYQSFHQTYSSIPGFSYLESLAIWDFLLDVQHEFRIGGDLMEIGVYYGKSAALMAMHAQKDEEIFLVDCTDFVDHAKVYGGKDQG